jgi:hypothetical protein
MALMFHKVNSIAMRKSDLTYAVRGDSRTAIAREQLCGHIFLTMREHTIMVREVFCTVYAKAIE